MTYRDDDRDLRERFAALRAEETQAAPSFARVRAPLTVARRQWRNRALVLAAGAALVIALLVPWPERAPLSGNGERMSITEWRSPTAFLLESSAAPLLQATPAVGERWVMAP